MRSLMMVSLHRNMSELFNVNFYVNFKIVFRTIHLRISWSIKKKTLLILSYNITTLHNPKQLHQPQIIMLKRQSESSQLTSNRTLPESRGTGKEP